MEDLNLPWHDIKARGLTLIQFKRYLDETFENRDVKRILSTMPKPVLESVLDAKKGNWYPFEYQRQFREAIIKFVNPSDPSGVMYKMGLVTASWDFSSFLKPLFSFVNMKTVLNRSATLWGKYYSRGKMKVASFKEGYSALELTDFQSDPHFCPIVTSWMMVALETLNKSNPQVTHQTCVHKGNSLCRFELKWD